MIRTFLLFIACLAWAIGALALRATDATPVPVERAPRSIYENVAARSALVYDVASGTLLFQKNVNTQYPPASTTKLMTALLVFELTRGEGNVRVEAGDTRVEPSHVPLRPGEVVSVRNLLHALLIASDNDAALALARYTSGGDLDRFIGLMNQKARLLGCQRTNFVNPNGLPARGHLTTALDLLHIFQAAIAIPELRQICMTERYPLATAARRQILENHNRLLGRYPGMGPAKTGWTLSSRHTYAASCTRNGRELQIIILNSPDKWHDATVLLDYGFSHLPPLEGSTLARQRARRFEPSPRLATVHPVKVGRKREFKGVATNAHRAYRRSPGTAGASRKRHVKSVGSARPERDSGTRSNRRGNRDARSS